jgi:hypothetical protein
MARSDFYQTWNAAAENEKRVNINLRYAFQTKSKTLTSMRDYNKTAREQGNGL